MAFNELELKRIDRTVGVLCRRSSPAEHADKLRFECAIDGHTVSIMEMRPPWDGRPGDWTRHGVYEPEPATNDLARLVKVVEEDKYCAFFG